MKDKDANSASHKLILIGEDDIDDQELLSEMFDEVDPSFNLKFVTAGRKLLTVLDALDDRHMPCLIVLDYNMPELNGAEILRILKGNRRYDPIPKIVWSSSRSETFRKICLESGANDYIVKPSNINELAGTIKYLLSFC